MYKKTVKMLLISGITMIVIGCSTGPFSPRAGDADGSIENLSLTLQLDKDVYSSEDPVIVTVNLANNSDSRVTVKSRMLPAYDERNIRYDKFHDVVYKIQSPSGKFVQLGIRYQAPELSTDDFVSLAPKESIQFSFDIKEHRIFPDEYGVYSVSLVYYNYYDPSWFTTAWKGELQSNTVYFEIKQP